MTQFEPAAHKAINLATSKSAAPRADGQFGPVRRKREAFAGRGLTFWAQWLTAVFALCVLLFALVVDKTNDIGPQYRLQAIVALLGSVPIYSLLRVYYKHHGHCIAVDSWFIVSKTPEEARLIRTAREVNDSKPEWVINKVKQAVAEYLMKNADKTAKDVTIASFGLAFKPDIDDLRESPALAVTQQIAADHPGVVLAVEPNIKARLTPDARTQSQG